MLLQEKKKNYANKQRKKQKFIKNKEKIFYKIVDYKGIVSGEVVLGTGFLSEFTASFSDALGIESGTFAKKMSEAKQGALNNLIMNALLQGGNALIGVDFDYITFSNNILGVSANGTAVVIEKEEK